MRTSDPIILSVPFASTADNLELNFTVVGGGLLLFIQTIDGSPFNFSVFDEYRYVIIPQGTDLSSLNIADYESVMAHFNL